MIRDHDYLEIEGSWLFCVIGDIHPPNKVISYLKYLPGKGPWRRGKQSFKRFFENYSPIELKRSVDFLKRVKPDLVFLDPRIGVEVPAVPLSRVKKHYSCLDGLKRLESKTPISRIEEAALKLIDELVEHSSISRKRMGLTGSILLGIHHERSDIDLVIYGGDEYWRALQALSELGYSGIKNRSSFLERMLKRYPISIKDAKKILERIKSKGVYLGIEYSIHAVRRLEEIKERYFDKVYKKVGLAKSILRIMDSEESCFNPAIYKVEGDAEIGGVRYSVDQLMCYDLTFASILKQDDWIEAYGKLELVIDKIKGKRFYSLLIGSMEAAGREYIKII